VSRFLLVSLNIKGILQETTLHRRREKLSIMPNGLGLGDAYDATIQRIKAQEGDRARLGMATLMWISHSVRPLNVDELSHALAVEIGSADINTNNVPSIRTVLACCQGLVAVDKGSSTVRLIHFTLKEYLSNQTDLFDRPHSKIAETCLTYLNFQSIKDLSASPFRNLRGTPFLDYSSIHWGAHMRIEFSDHSRCLALDLLDQYDHHISAELLWESTHPWRPHSWGAFSALHCISYFGIAEVATDLIEANGSSVNQRDGEGLTPLMWAARYGSEEVVELLLQQKHTQPDITDTHYGQTALSWAAEKGHEGVVRIFLGQLFVNPGSIGRWWGTQQVMSLLFGRGYVNPDKADDFGWTPLSWAARNGHGGAVKLLLEREDVSPNRPDNDGQTPLSWAAKNGHDVVAKLLLGREDVSSDRPDNDGQTPLSLAACHGHDGVAKLLLGREDVNPDRPDNDGQTPLSLAACHGNYGVAKLLLGREGVILDSLDNKTRTPLSWAAYHGHDGVVKLLLSLEDICPDRPDNDGQTPLSWAARNGRDGVVRILLELEDVSLDRQDNAGQTPLSWAARNGHGGVVKLLLEREDVSPNRPDNDGRTPLGWAAENGHDRVVKLLLGQEHVSSNRPDPPHRPRSRSRSPFRWKRAKRLKGQGVEAPTGHGLFRPL